MTKKKRNIVLICVLLAIALLVPLPRPLDDGGSVEYRASLYTVTDHHSFVIDHETDEGYFREGITIEILGFEVFRYFEK